MIICFTDKGEAVVDKLNDRLLEKGMEPAKCHTCLDTFAKEGFETGSALIFVGAVGIAVRTVAPFVRDKLTDSPVIVIDDNADFVIPILSGHAGGANKLAQTIAMLLDAIPVITTSTDVNSAFSPDVFAAENRLTIRNRDGIKKVSSKSIEGKPVTISIKDYPPAGQVDIIIADETDRDYSLLLSPKPYTVGIGLRKGISAEKLEGFVLNTLQNNGIQIGEVYAFATIDIKENEEALVSLRDKYRIPLISFEAEVLAKASGEFSASEFVKDTVGVDNVCERAAILAAGFNGKLIAGKTAGDGMTNAIAKRQL